MVDRIPLGQAPVGQGRQLVEDYIVKGKDGRYHIYPGVTTAEP